MNLHPEIQTLLKQYKEKKTISLDEKQFIIKRALELDQDLKVLIEALDSIEENPIRKSAEICKCEACGEIIPALDRVCPSCKNVKISSETIDIKLDDLIIESESILAELKSLDAISYSKRLLKNCSISFPVFIGSSFVLGWNFNSDVLAGVFFCSLLLWLLVIRRLKRNLFVTHYSQKPNSFQVLISQIENKIRLLELYYGNDSRTKEHTVQLKQELKHLRTSKNKIIYFEVFTYVSAFILLVIIGYFTII
jgi:hypothetical protein